MTSKLLKDVMLCRQKVLLHLFKGAQDNFTSMTENLGKAYRNKLSVSV